MELHRGAIYNPGDIIVYRSNKKWIQARVTKVNPKSIRIEDGMVNNEGLFIPSGIINKTNKGSLNFLCHRIFTYVVKGEKYTAEGIDQEILNKRYGYLTKWKSPQMDSTKAFCETLEDLESWMNRKETEWREELPRQIFDSIMYLEKKLTPPRMPIMDSPIKDQTHQEPVVETPKPMVVETSPPVSNADWLTTLKEKFEDLCVSEFSKDLGNITIETIQNYLISEGEESDLTEHLKVMVSKWTKFGNDLRDWINEQPNVTTTIIENAPFQGEQTKIVSKTFEQYVLERNATRSWLFNTGFAHTIAEEEESSEDEIEVVRIQINGDEYFLDEETGVIYHPVTQEQVGQSKNGIYTLN